MKYKEFSDWCNERACDGCWSMATAIYCIDVCKKINQERFWRREKIWQNEYEDIIVNKVVKPIEEKMKKVGLIREEQK